MKNKKFICAMIGIFILFTLCSYAETKKIRRLGRNTFVRIKGEIPTAEVMKTILDKFSGDIKYGFDLAGYGELYLPFIEQIKEASFEEKQLPIGDKLMWMLYRSQGKVKVVVDVEWAGKAPLSVFSFHVKKGYMHYEFIMPKPCGNISLRKIEEIIPDAVCDIRVDPAKANINDPITVDMSGSQDAGSMEVEVFNADGVKIASQKLTPESSKWQTKFDKPGEYVFKGKAFNVKGKPSENPCEAKTYINFPPVCTLSTTCPTCKNYVGSPITFDATDSSDPDGEVVKANFEIVDETGNVVAAFEGTDKPFIWERIFENPGVYTVTVIVTDDFGGISEPCRIELEVIHKKLFFMVDGGPLFARGSYGPYLTGSLGIVYRIVPQKFDVALSGGPALALKGDPWKSAFKLTALFNVHGGPAYFGAGLGFTSKVRKERDSDTELVGNIGFEVCNKYTRIGSIFFEGRSPIGEGRKFSKHHKLMFGFKFLF